MAQAAKWLSYDDRQKISKLINTYCDRFKITPTQLANVLGLAPSTVLRQTSPPKNKNEKYSAFNADTAFYIAAYFSANTSELMAIFCDLRPDWAIRCSMAKQGKSVSEIKEALYKSGYF